jgi:hypothetical protein
MLNCSERGKAAIIGGKYSHELHGNVNDGKRASGTQPTAL